MEIHNYVEIKQHTLNDQWVKEEITVELENTLRWMKNGNTTYQSLWDAEKAAFPRKFIAMFFKYSHILKKEIPQINNLSFCLKKLDKGRLPWWHSGWESAC